MWSFFSRKKKERASPQRYLNARYDAAQTTAENIRHWSMADGLSADASMSRFSFGDTESFRLNRFEELSIGNCRGIGDTRHDNRFDLKFLHNIHQTANVIEVGVCCDQDIYSFDTNGIQVLLCLDTNSVTRGSPARLHLPKIEAGRS